MPHIIIETSREIKNANKILSELHDLLPSVGPFIKSEIKSRIHYCESYHVAEGNQHFLHCQIKIMPGRSLEIKNTLSESVLNYLTEELKNDSVKTSFSVEICELDKESYNKITV